MLSTGSVSFKMSDSYTLFDQQTPTGVVSDNSETDAAKRVIDKLLKVRRSLTDDEQRFGLPRVNLLIEELRSLARATPTQREEMVLYAVERSGATTETEISEDTRLHRDIVKEVVQGLCDKKLLYSVPRTVIGSGRPQFAIKSTRVKTPEAD